MMWSLMCRYDIEKDTTLNYEAKDTKWCFGIYISRVAACIFSSASRFANGYRCSLYIEPTGYPKTLACTPRSTNYHYQNQIRLGVITRIGPSAIMGPTDITASLASWNEPMASSAHSRKGSGILEKMTWRVCVLFASAKWICLSRTAHAVGSWSMHLT